MTQKRLELKNEIKSLAQQIKDKKKALRDKELQSVVAARLREAHAAAYKFQLEVNAEEEPKDWKKPKKGWFSKKPNYELYEGSFQQNKDKRITESWFEYHALVKELFVWAGLPSLQEEFRIKHIVASLLRGKTLRQIESKNHEGNSPSRLYKIKELIKEYNDEVPFNIELLYKNDREGAFAALRETII